MSILTWNDQLLVGIDSVDNQHRHLVGLINRLDELNALGADLQTVIDTVKQLLDYSVYHFQHEEQLMADVNFNPRLLAEHRQQHQDFIDKVQQVQIEAQTDISVISKDLLDFLVDWLCHHILKTDKLMAISLNQGVDAAQILIDKDEHVDILHSNLYSALRESEERFKELADHLPALIWITNSKNLPIFCNRFWFKTFNIERGFVDRRQWLNTIHPDDRDKVVQTYQQAALELTKFKIQYRLCTADAKETWILETAVPRVRKNGKFAGLMGCGMDISTQKQAETALLKLNQQLEERVRERTQALTEANQTLQMEKNQQTLLNQQLQETQAHLVQSEKMASIGQLAAGVAHEINNPLGYIYSNLNSLKQYIQELTKAAELAERLAGQLADNHPDAQAFKQFKNAVDLDFLKGDAADLVEESLEGATRAKKIVQDLRDFSRIDKQGREMFDLEAGIDATLNIVNNELKYKAEVVKEYGGIKPFECVGAQLNQVFMNLLVNAAQAIEDFGKITVRTGYQDADWLWVEVEDNGQGMNEATRARMFDPFFTTKPVGKGTGLGLSLSYKIIQDHHGRIEIDSEIGRGTRFRIYLPTCTPAS
ncbi:bacteriohemerythrin [Methylomonas sp. MO1]|uniref:bacteriohemerythrin n=1 Tax=unclassified Methylomonas TaxID=2608980 RepID=UPI000478DC44|nr:MULTISPECIES: bacteriohemerythrin [unclassified Methylomonas]MDT4288340.1 bacteriohemerythrin [Methylomonas sp. MO1]